MDRFGQESEIVEFKKSTAQIDRALKTVCAFLNHKGGAIYFGVDDKNKLIGQDVSDSTIRSISQKIRQKIKPEISPEVKVLEIKSKKVIEVKIKEGSSKPYYLDGVAYKRTGTESPAISPEELERIILDKKKRYWDSEICDGAKLEDIDENKVRWFLREAKKERGLNITEYTPVKEVLMKLKLLQDKNPINAAMLLFAKKPWFLQSEVKCIRFFGNKPVKPYIDFQTLEGNVIDLIDGAEEFVLKNIKKSIWLVPGQVQREEKYEYPSGAVREAIINAVVHRDWESPSKVQVRVFDDYIEIWNPGKLPDGWTVEKLKQKHESIPKNPLLFKQLFLIKYVEDVGGGTVDMIGLCNAWGIPEPEFEDMGTSIIVTFRKFIVTEELMNKLSLNERQKRVIEYLKEHGKITNNEYCKLFDIVKDTANRDLNDLLSKCLIEKKGSGPKTHYILTTVRYRPIPSDNLRKQ